MTKNQLDIAVLKGRRQLLAHLIEMAIGKDSSLWNYCHSDILDDKHIMHVTLGNKRRYIVTISEEKP